MKAWLYDGFLSEYACRKIQERKSEERNGLANVKELKEVSWQRLAYRVLAALSVLLVGSAWLGRAAGEDVVIPARDCSARSPNVQPADAGWDGLMVCHGTQGFVEWTFDIRAVGDYYVHAYVTSGEQRPVALSINERRLPGSYLDLNTGGFRAQTLQWATLGPFALRQGSNKLRIDVTRLMPHLGGLVVSDRRTGWNQNAFASQLRVGPDPALVELEGRQMQETRALLRNKFGIDEILFIKRITYTSTHYYSEFIDSRWTPGGGIYVLSLKDGSLRSLTTGLEGGVFGRMDLSWDAKKVVFDWKRTNEEGYRIYEVEIDGSGLRQILAAPENEAALVEKYRLEYHHGTDDMHPCYLPDGGIAFVSTRCQASTLCHGGDVFTTTVLYRMDADGGHLQQLSFGALSEFTPTVLPDGRIMYARWEYVDKGAVAAKCIWAMWPDGTGAAEIYGNDIPFPTTMSQARPIPGVPCKYVLLGCPHYPQNALGTILRIDMGKPIRTDEPMTYVTPEVQVLAEGGWHFRDSASGQMVADRDGQGPLFRDPWPLDEDHHLVAHKPRGYGGAYTPNGYGLYLLDSTGRPLPCYRDPDISCWQPVPRRARPAPPVPSSTLDADLAKGQLARCVVTDVYHGLENVERGSIAYLRILEQIPRPWSARRSGNRMDDSYDQQYAVVSKDTALGLKVQHGVVPVEQDGSAHFLVPASANIFLQALDENYLAVQTERTFVNYMPGETRSCVGCHETPSDVLESKAALPIALCRAPSLPGPQIGETSGRRPLHYPTDVQPVFDRHCVPCHNQDRKDGGLDLTGRLTQFFSASYENLLVERREARKDRVDPDLVPTIGENHPKTGNIRYLPARSLGSHNSLLMAMLMPEKIKLSGDEARLRRLTKLVEAHRDLALRPDELLKISNWVDTNAQYYGSYYGRRNVKDQGHPNFRPVPTWESALGIPPVPEGQP